MLMKRCPFLCCISISDSVSMTSAMYAVLVAALIASTTARTITVERVSVSLSEDETMDSAITSIVEQVLSGSSKFGDVLSPFSKCVGAECCAKVEGKYNVCFKASLVGNNIHLDVTVNGYKFISGDITGPNPKPICADHLPPQVTKACINIKDLDLSKHYGCVEAEVVAMGQSAKIDIGCFQLKGTELSHDDIANIELPAGSVLKFIPTDKN